MLTLSEFARLKNWSRTYVHQLLKAGRIPGALKIGGDGNKGFWLIPDDAKVIKK
jgi:hypothetical protein